MNGLLASQSCYHSVLPLVCVHCGPVVDFFITKQTSLHPFDFVRNLFHLLVLLQIQRAILCTILQHKNNESMPSFLLVVWISLGQRDLKMSSDLISVCSTIVHLSCIGIYDYWYVYMSSRSSSTCCHFGTRDCW